MAQVLPCKAVASMNKPSWIDTLEESLLLAIGLFSLITWIVVIGH